MKISERDSKAIDISDEHVDTRSKDSHEIIDIDAIYIIFIPYQYKRKRAVFLNHCIEKIIESKQIYFEKTKKKGCFW